MILMLIYVLAISIVVFLVVRSLMRISHSLDEVSRTLQSIETTLREGNPR